MTLKTGKTIQYDALISTIPLPFTLKWAGKDEWANDLKHRCIALLIAASNPQITAAISAIQGCLQLRI